MSTRSAFTVVGAVVGAYFGSAALGASIGSMVGGYVDPVKTKGPRLTDASQQTSQDGVPIPLTFGVVKVVGNIIASSELTEHKSKDSGKGSGTENTTYTYTRTYAIGICEGPIGGIRRIWKNAKLVYDAQPDSGLDPRTRILLMRFLTNHPIYAGDEAQVPDPNLQAVFGADKVPAFRGLAYMVSVDEDVTAYAGAIPTYEFEIVTTGSAFPIQEYVPATYVGVMPFVFQPESTPDPRFIAGAYSYAPFTPTGISTTRWPSLIEAVVAAASSFGHRPYDKPPVPIGWGDGGSSGPLGWASGRPLYPWQGAGTTHDQHSTSLTLAVTREEWDAASEAQGIGFGGGTFPCLFFQEGRWAAQFTTDNPGGGTSGGFAYPSGVYMFTVAPEQIADADGSTACSGSAPGRMYHFGDYLIDVRAHKNCGAIIDPSWMLVPGTIDTYVDRYGEFHSPGDCTVVNGTFHQLADLVLNDAGTNWVQEPVGPVFPDSQPQTEAFWTDAYEHAVALDQMPAGLVYAVDYPVAVTQACLCAIGENVFENDVTLAEIVSALCFRAGLTGAEIDVSELTDRVIGFTVATDTNAADAINTLAPAFFFDGSEWDAKIRFIKRGHDHVAVLTIDDSVESDDPRIKEVRAQDVELPRQITLSYFDPQSNYGITTQTAKRRSVTVNATGTDSLQLPVVMLTDEAAQVADMLLKDKWASLAGTLEQTIADKFSYLTPTDIVQVQSDGALFRVRLGPITTQDGTLNYQATQDVQSAYTSNVEGFSPPDPSNPVSDPVGPTLAIYLNLPALRDRDDQVGIYVAATGVTGNWSGALIEVSRDGGGTWSTATTVIQPATIGQTFSSLSTWTPDVPQVADVQVKLTSGALFNITDAQLFQQGNGCVIGSELLQFRDATLTSPKEYDIDYLIRGRKNTQVSAHAVGEDFCLTSDLYFIPLERSDIGRTLKFRATTLGTANSEGVISTVAFTRAISVTEWPVTNISAARASGGDLSFRWSPRARLGDAASPYQSQLFSGYQLAFTSGGVTKTYSTADQSFTYTAAQQATDFGSAPVSMAYTIAATNTITGAGDSRGGTI